MNFIVCCLLVIITGQVESWPAFLGQGATPVDSKQLPLKWSATENIYWKQPIAGYGQSSPIIWDNKVFVTSVVGQMKEELHLICYDLSSGKQLWDTKLESTNPEKNSVYISRAAPTPVVDENQIIAYFESGDVAAIDHTGKILWTRSLSKDYGKPENTFGLSASPVQAKDRIVVLIDDTGSSYVVALDKKTGKTLWKTDRENRTSWSSPALATIQNTAQVICSSAGSIDGYDLASGQQLWSFSEVGGNSGTTPMEVNEGQFLIAASPGRRGENAEMAKKSNGLLQVKKEGETWSASYLWTNEKATPSWASPIVNQSEVYWINRVGAVFCFDQQTGEQYFVERLKQSCWATPVALGDKIYFFGKDGTTTVLEAGKKFNILAENQLWTEDQPPLNNLPKTKETDEERRSAAAMFSRPTVYGVALAKNSIVVRTGSQLFCIRAVK